MITTVHNLTGTRPQRAHRQSLSRAALLATLASWG